jgi:hypothetical protein
MGLGLAKGNQPQALIQALGRVDMEHLEFEGCACSIGLVAEPLDQVATNPLALVLGGDLDDREKDTRRLALDRDTADRFSLGTDDLDPVRLESAAEPLFLRFIFPAPGPVYVLAHRGAVEPP